MVRSVELGNLGSYLFQGVRVPFLIALVVFVVVEDNWKALQLVCS